jgi:hypothetical protein
MSERDIDAQEVRREHITEVNATAHAAYLLLVLGGATVLMVLLLVLLDSAT